MGPNRDLEGSGSGAEREYTSSCQRSKGVTLKNHKIKSSFWLIVAVAVVALGLVVAGCGSSDEGGSSSTTDQGTPKPGGTYNYPLSAEPVCIEPLNAQESEGIQVAHQVFIGLVNYEGQADDSIKVVPGVAESWSSNEDGSVWTFKLRQDATFAPPVSRVITAQDFIYSWNRATDPKNQSYVSYILSAIEGCDDGGYAAKGLTGLKAIDDYTLEVTLRYPFAEFPMTLGHTVAAPVPQETVEKMGNKAFGDKPVGNGPYMVQEWKHNEKVVLVKNPDYWDKDNVGWVDTINMPVYLQSSTEWLDFQKGTIDYSHVPPGQVTASQNMPEVKDGTWTAKKYPNLGVYFVGVNMNNAVVGGANGLPLRQALYHGLDQQAVINVVNEGVGLPAQGYVPVGISGYLPNQSPYTFDPEKAKQMAAEVGAPTLSYWYNTDEGHQKIAEAVQASWEAAGIKTELANFEWGTYLDKIKGDEHQLFRMGWGADYPSMDNFLFPLFQSSQAPYMGNFYDNPEFDALLQEARGTADENARHELYAQAEKMALTDIPAVPIYFYQLYRVTNNRIGGFNKNSMDFTDMWKVWVK